MLPLDSWSVLLLNLITNHDPHKYDGLTEEEPHGLWFRYREILPDVHSLHHVVEVGTHLNQLGVGESLVIHLPVPLIEFLVLFTVGETLLPDSYGISYTQIPELLEYEDINKLILALEVVGFDAPHETQSRFLEFFDELLDGLTELGSQRLLFVSLPSLLFGFLLSMPRLKDLEGYFILGLLHGFEDVGSNFILVLGLESYDIILHIPGCVFDDEHRLTE